MIKYTIYALCEPDSEAIRYIGQTRRPIEKRFIEHIGTNIKETPHLYKSRWIAKILRSGNIPNMIILDEIFVEDISAENQLFIDKWEYFYIQKYKNKTRLTNGREVDGFHIANDNIRKEHGAKTKLTQSKKGFSVPIKLEHTVTKEVLEFISVEETARYFKCSRNRIDDLRRGQSYARTTIGNIKKALTYKGYRLIK